ncbi:reverse transcriptase domain-containing protein [Mulberry dwarf phytoplasma]|uniref:reverse transcriptase domain-containing protein n=1 Tax=Mulberry dwarf phytoplasma TaxID=186171 RepID=UPI001D120BAB|nr:reverse transcriptase domain-containing protein [Mulberry dwarf phytoplasma]
MKQSPNLDKNNDLNKTKFKLFNVLNQIQSKASNNQSIKKDMQKAMNNLENYYMAFNKIARNQGAGTIGVDKQTINGISIKRIQKWHEEYINNQYVPKPVRKILIPKSNGKKRPLGIPTIKDRTIQQVMNQTLIPFYEKKFSQWSYGFRPNRSCHDAIKRFQQRFKGIDYFIKVDIEGYFDAINHDILLKLINQDVKKHKTIKTIYNWLTAGLMENGSYGKTFSGTPQGGIISPLLSNIYLHKYLDMKMSEMVQLGIPRNRANPIYKKIYKMGGRAKTQKVNSQINTNPNTRVEYLRYADDFIIGIKGEQDKAIKVLNQVKNLLTKELKLTISADKTKIIKANKGIRFLGYLLKVNPTNESRPRKTGKNSLNGKTRMMIPKDEISTRITKLRWKNNRKIIQDKALSYREELEIVKTYKSVLHGIIRYFAYGANLGQLTYLAYIAEYSCLKTLAGKYKTSIKKIRQKFRFKKTWAIKYTSKDSKVKREIWNIMNWEKIKSMRNHKSNIDVDTIPNKYFLCGGTFLTDRLSAIECEICKISNVELEIHHRKTVRNRNWKSVLNKETMVLCKYCHRNKTNQQIKSFNLNLSRKK